MGAFMEKAIICFGHLFLGCLFFVPLIAMDSDTHYQSSVTTNANNNIINNTFTPSVANPGSAIDKMETIFDIKSINPGDGNGKETDNRKLLENAGFEFSALPEPKKSTIFGETKDGVTIPPEMVPVILKFMNNNIDAGVKNTQKNMQGGLAFIADSMSNSKNPVVSKFGTAVKMVASSLGISGSITTGGVATLITFIVAKKLGWI
jgi:hypothetical protein